jgi:plastocyanin
VIHGLRRTAAVASVALLALLSACGGGESDGGEASTADPGGATETSAAPSEGEGGEAGGDAVAIAGFAYEPGDLEVEVGATVTFTNEDTADHTATSQEDAPVAFDTEDLGEGDAADVTFDEEGEYRYFCSIHDYMEGTVRVVGAEG